MHHKIHLSWLISCVTLMLSGRLSKPQLTLPTHTQLEPAQTVAPLKPRPIEEWTEPSAQEVARQLLAIDRHRSLLNSLVENLSTAQLSGELPHKERLISQLSGNIARVTWYPPIATEQMGGKGRDRCVDSRQWRVCMGMRLERFGKSCAGSHGD